MMRTIYAAGINGGRRAAEAAVCPYWLLSVTLLRRKIPPWLSVHLPGLTILWDPGTFMAGAVSYRDYRRFLEQHEPWCRDYLQYDEPGDPVATAWYLGDMRRRGFHPIPVLQPGGDLSLLDEPQVAIGGLVPMSRLARIAYLDALFYPKGYPRRVGHVHLLGMSQAFWFLRYPAASGDSTTWIPRAPYNRRKTVAQWLAEYGRRPIPLLGPPATALPEGCT